MSRVTLNDAYLTATANAIRSKTGGNGTMTPAQFATAIGSISGGGGSSPYIYEISQSEKDLGYIDSIPLASTVAILGNAIIDDEAIDDHVINTPLIFSMGCYCTNSDGENGTFPFGAIAAFYNVNSGENLIFYSVNIFIEAYDTTMAVQMPNRGSIPEYSLDISIFSLDEGSYTVDSNIVFEPLKLFLY